MKTEAQTTTRTYRLGDDIGTITKAESLWVWKIMGQSGTATSLQDAMDDMVDEWNIQHDND
jgi:hypothetical protein